MSTSRKLLLGATAGVIAMAAALSPAAAKSMHHHHHFHAFGGPVEVTSGYSSCDYYYWRWKQTGSRAWRSRYLVCIS